MNAMPENPSAVPPVDPAQPAPAEHIFFSPARIGAIAGNTLLELVRLKVFYFLLIFALVLIGGFAVMPEFNFQEQFQLLKDVSLGAMSIFTWLLSVLATAMLLPKDIEDRTLYTILAKPVPRFEYLLGKLIGILLLLLVSLLVMTVLFVIALYGRQQLAISETIRTYAPDQVAPAIAGIKASTFTISLIPGIVIIYIKAALFASLTLFISTFASSSVFTIMVSTACYFIGHLQGTAREVWLGSATTGPLPRIFLALVALIFPDLQLFNLVDDIVAGNSISLILFAKTAALGALYTCIYFLVAYFVFASKEL
jgi:ABC-type transport system involved in multi-copper enzyme maturation permease subunit